MKLKFDFPLKEHFLPYIGKLGFHLPYVKIFSSTEYDQTTFDVFDFRHNFYGVKVMKYHAETFSEISSVKIQSHRWVGYFQLSI